MSDERGETEGKVVFVDGGKERAIRGIIEEEDHFIVIHRRDGVLKVAKQCVLKIEKWDGRECDEDKRTY